VLDDERALAELLHAGTQGGLISGAVDLSEGGLAQALADGALRFGVGARVWIDEIVSRDEVDDTAALFSESQARVLVAVPHEEEVKFRGLCSGRGFPVLRIGVTDGVGPDAVIEVQDRFTLPLAELRGASQETLPSRFGAVIAE
jgi:phosphoribosylformylglycinamidine synthase